MPSLIRQARLAALACLLVDAAVLADATGHLPVSHRTAALIGIVVADALLALPTKYSGRLACLYAVATMVLALALRTTPDIEWGLAGGTLAAYRVGAWMRDRASVAAVLVLAAGAVGWGALASGATAVAIWTGPVRNAFIPWLIGRYTSARRRYISELRLGRELELRDATAQMERATDQLRASVSRDLHDVISHHVSAIGAHAGAARLRLAARPGTADPETTKAIAAVEHSSRAAMADLRRVLDILHGSPDPTNQIGLGNLDQLFDGVEGSGLNVQFKVSGEPRQLPGSVDIALYRIAQEMLTNALRHGDGEGVVVELTFTAGAVELSARNGIGPPPEVGEHPLSGRGLAGIRGRAALFGGQARYGPTVGGKTWETKVTVRDETPPRGEEW
jgi:signal transduction histidine kinase